jgi:DNA repair protein RecO (recombination protein O)
MEYRDEAILLSKALFGEQRCHGVFLTRQQGRWRVSLPKKSSLILQPGDIGSLRWYASSTERLAFGHYERISSPFSALLTQPLALLALKSACTLCLRTLVDQAPAEPMFLILRQFLGCFSVFSPVYYLLFEKEALAALGFGLNLTHCAVTGEASGLAFVSPRTGCAVSEAGAGTYRDKLLPLPPFLVSFPKETAQISLRDLQQGFLLTEYFLARALQALRPTLSLPLERRLLQEAAFSGLS